MVKKTNNQKKVHFNFFSRIPSIILFIFLKIKFLLRVAFLALIATIIGIVILLKSILPYGAFPFDEGQKNLRRFSYVFQM